MIKKLFLVVLILFVTNVFATDYYVSTNGSNSNNGLSETNAWRTIDYAAGQVSAGDTVWIKAGDYGNENVAIDKSGTSSSPISFIGYQNTPGDDPDLGWSFPGNTALKSSVMPYIEGNDETKSEGIRIRANYIVIKNIQIKNYSALLHIVGSRKGNVIDNVIVSQGVYGILIDSDNTDSNIVRNSIVYRAATAGIRMYGHNNLIEDCKVYDDRKNTGGGFSMDYYIVIRGNNNIVRNCYLERVGNTDHAGHGIAIKSVGRVSEYNLVENLEIIGIKGSIEARHDEVRFNTFRNIKIWRKAATDQGDTGGISIMNGASYNVFENITVDNTQQGINFLSSNEKPDAPSAGHHNVFKNCVFSNNTYGIRLQNDSGGQNRETYNNLIVNSNFYGNTYIFLNTSDDVRNNEIVNCNVTSTLKREASNQNQSHGFSYTYSNFFNNTNFAKPSGAGNVAFNPGYVNAANVDFHLLGTSAIKELGKDMLNSPWTRPDGVAVEGVLVDADGAERTVNFSIGAYEKDDSFTGAVSPDVSICEGENATLVASGGTSYDWSTGESTGTIVVSPTVTTTYTVVISDGSKTKSFDVIVTVEPIPTANAGADVTICSGQDTVLTAVGEGDFLWSNGETTASITVNPNITTTYTVTSSNTCTTTATDDVIVTVIPGITLDAGEDQSICAGNSVILTATSNGDFLWSTGETTASITVSPTTTTTYTVTSSNGSCEDTDEIIVTIDSLTPEVDLGEDQTICAGEDIVLTATGVGNFLWNTGETTATISVSPSSTTTYSVTASNACDTTGVTDEIIVDVTPEITVDAGSDLIICSGDSTTLTATGNGSFLWNTGETTASITVSPTSNTTYSVTSSIGSCSLTDEVIVTVDEQPVVSLDADVDVCYGESITLTATGQGDFLWSNGEVTSSIVVSPTVTTTYTVTATSSCDTVGVSDDITVNVLPEITLDAGSDETICNGESITLTATSNGDYLWNTGETTASITVSPTSTTTYSVTSNNGTCSITDEVEVRVDNPASVDLGDDITICSDDNSVTLIASGSGNFLWSTGETTESITVSPSSTTTYSITATSSCDTAGVTDEITVNVTPEIIVDAGANSTICSGQSLILTATGNGSFLWSTGETTASITVNPSTTTEYTVTATVGGCSESDDVIVTVDDAPSVDLGADLTICYGETVILTATGDGDFLWSTGAITQSIEVSPSTTTTYTVTTSSSCDTNGVSDDIIVNVTPEVSVAAGADVVICQGQSATLTATGAGSFLWSTGATTASITVSPTTTTNYTVTASNGECSESDVVKVTVNDLPTVSLEEDLAICNGDQIILTASGSGNFLWSTGETTSSITVNPSITTTYTISASGSCGASVSDEIVVSVNELPVVYAGDDLTIESGMSTILTAQGEGSFLWNTGETTASITVSPINTTTYTVTATSESSCSSSDTVIVTVEIPADDDPVDDDPHGFIYAGQDVELCGQGASVTLTATGGDVYLWDTGEYTASITVSPTETTTYSVTGSAGDEIGSDEVTVYVDEACLGATNRPSEENMLIYPNPTKDILNIELTGFSDEINISLYNLNGSKVFTESIQNTSRNKVLKHRLNLSKLGRGVYFVRLINLGEVYTKKIMVI